MLKRLLLSSLGLATLASSVGATWSICVVNRRTGEVAIASATCLPSIDLMVGLPMVRVGQGVGAIQSAGWEPGLVIMFDLLPTGATPQQILDAVLAAAPAKGNLQIGIAGMVGAPVSFTGGQVGAAKGSRVGVVGDLAYAIQGNVLSGSNVWVDCEDALLNTPGDLSQKLMAAMEAAALAGGDGRCSCDPFAPTSCGSPPPSFTKSAHVGFMILARIGDTNPTCTNGNDCAQPGVYFLKLNVRNAAAMPNDPDPVLQLREKYDQWRGNRIGQADGILSTVSSVQSMPADGGTQRTVTVRLVDIDGTALTHGGDDVQVATVDGGPSIATVGPVVDHGDGSYSFTLHSGNAAGLDRFVITADAGMRRATLFPYLEVRSDPVAPLHAGYDAVSVSDGANVPFVLDLPGNALHFYILLGSLSGTSPGTNVGSVFIPLNSDSMTWATLLRAGDPRVLPGTIGVLDASGRAEAAFVLGPRQILALSGLRLDWAALVVGSPTPTSTNAVGFDILP